MGRTATQQQRSPLPSTQSAELKQPALTKKDDPTAIIQQSTPLSTPQNANPAQSVITENDVRIRAYELYLERGGVPGDEVDDWLQAERELLAD
jgi:hypothetical protein